ncbi:peptidoglycan-binding protein [Streptomyces sp. NPDC059819]|uniref:peptidoglycan-binding domain-containing protein n=1 Tax=Streptomyces sp. NPDC059819 TaxID=3346963 RepID=UPI003649B439
MTGKTLSARAGIAGASAALAVIGAVALSAGPAAAAPARATLAVTPAHFTCTYTTDEPQLSVGSSQHTAIKQAQCQLNSVLDRRVTVDGIFGSGTKSATIAFQQCAGLSADGIIGPNTWSALDNWWLNDIDCHK